MSETTPNETPSNPQASNRQPNEPAFSVGEPSADEGGVYSIPIEVNGPTLTREMLEELRKRAIDGYGNQSPEGRAKIGAVFDEVMETLADKPVPTVAAETLAQLLGSIEEQLAAPRRATVGLAQLLDKSGAGGQKVFEAGSAYGMIAAASMLLDMAANSARHSVGICENCTHADSADETTEIEAAAAPEGGAHA